MAFIYMDFVGPIIENMNANYRFVNKIIRAWDKDGDLWHHKYIYYRYAGNAPAEDVRSDEPFKEFMKALGSSYEEMRANVIEFKDDIEYAYFYFNWNREDDEAVEQFIEEEDISKTMDSKLKKGDIAYVKMTYSGRTNMVIDGHKESWEITSDGRISMNQTNFSEMFKKIFEYPVEFIANVVNSKYERRTLQFTDIESGANSGLNTYRVPKGVNARVYNPQVTTSVRRGEQNNISNDSDIDLFCFALLDTEEGVFKVTRNNDGSKRIIDSGFMNSNPRDDSEPIKYQEEDVDPLKYPEYAKKYPEFLSRGSIIMEDWKTVDGFSKAGVNAGYYEVYEYEYIGGDNTVKLYRDMRYIMSKILKRDSTNNHVLNTMQKKTLSKLFGLETPTGNTTVDDYHLAKQQYEKIQKTNSISSHETKYERFSKFYDDKTGRLSTKKIESVPRHEFVDFVAECIDTDYEEADATVMEVIVAVIAVIAAIIVVVWSAGTAAPGVMGAMTALATGLGYASLVLTIGVMMLSTMGASAAGLVRIIGKVAQVVGYAAMITGIFAAVAGAYNAAAKEAVKTGAIENTTQYTVGMFLDDTATNIMQKMTSSATSFIDTVIDFATQDISGLLGQTAGQSTSLMGWMTRLQDAFNVYNKFFANEGTTQPANESEDQANKRSYQFPEQLFVLQEQVVYEKDALQKMSILKDQQLGGYKTEELMSAIA